MKMERIEVCKLSREVLEEKRHIVPSQYFIERAMRTISCSMRRSIVFLFLSFMTSAAIADSTRHEVNQCIRHAASSYNIPVELLSAIAKVESNMNPRTINFNRNGTKDIGLMQINSVWLPELEKYGITEDRLWDTCTNAMVGAWILARNIATFGFNVNALGSYNAGPNGDRKVKINYAIKVLERYHAENRVSTVQK